MCAGKQEPPDSRMICLTCLKLGNCSDTSFQKLKEGKGCGSWKKERDCVIEAREKSVEIASDRSLRAMIKAVSGGKSGLH
jgi:hypothetical protein